MNEYPVEYRSPMTYGLAGPLPYFSGSGVLSGSGSSSHSSSSMIWPGSISSPGRGGHERAARAIEAELGHDPVPGGQEDAP